MRRGRVSSSVCVCVCIKLCFQESPSGIPCEVGGAVMFLLSSLFGTECHRQVVGGCRGLVLNSAANEGLSPVRPNVPTFDNLSAKLAKIGRNLSDKTAEIGLLAIIMVDTKV